VRWDPDRYLEFTDDRLRPSVDLLARIPVDAPGTVWDLGCGTGLVTALLAERWPHADITGLDSSEDMLEVARRRTDIRWVSGDVNDWQPPEPADVAVCNAVLQWVDGHTALLPRLGEYEDRPRRQ
jgi:trans-aconitate 2-methyltransferase